MQKSTFTRGSLHRFHNTVAIYLGDGETIYLTPKEARKIAAGLFKFARDIETKDFSDSQVHTIDLK